MKSAHSFVLLVILFLGGIAGAQEIVTLPGTTPLTWTGDLSAKMHEAALADVDRRIHESIEHRAVFWHRDTSSPEAYEKSTAENRARFRQIIGVVDERVPVRMERYGDDANPSLVSETSAYQVHQVRWPVLLGVTGEGLLVEPKGKIAGMVIAIPDADQTPEQLMGLAPGIPAESQFARRLAENGFEVVVPLLIDRGTEGSGNAEILMTNQPHREWIYRQAFMMGRHIIGYEVEKMMSVVDWFESRKENKDGLHRGLPIGIAGYGEGGLLAFYTSAVDRRINATLVSGYFKPREQTWQEPLYRNVWGLLREFGDAEIATLIAPRALVIEHSDEPKVDGPPAPLGAQRKSAAPGRLETPSLEAVKAEFSRIGTLLPPNFQFSVLAGEPADKSGIAPGRQGAMQMFAGRFEVPVLQPLSKELPADRRGALYPAVRQLRQVKELETHVQRLIRESDHVRNKMFLYKLLPEYQNEPWTLQLRFDTHAPEGFAEAAKPYKKQFWEEVIGKIEDPLPPPSPMSRRVYDEPKWTGYEVALDVGGGGFSWGILCVPKDIKPGERRPVVVCQHGRHGLPKQVIEGDAPAYRNFAARLAEQGFVTFAPHNLYQKEDYYRILSRKGNTVKLSMFSYILRHHEQILNWLETLPFVDAKRIGFYGLSYGGETAVRVPPLLDRYCLSICSGDFNDWPRKVASTDDRHSFMFTDEWEMPYFNMGSTFSYAELTHLMFPRPFMVERGHHDGVAPDPWVAYEFAKTRWLYAQFGLADRTAIEFFNGGHTINGQGTFEFLHKHLAWPK